jgi:hypothetical protein
MANMAKRIDVSEKAQHRKIDVDAYDEDRYIEDEVVDNSADAAVSSRASDVKALLNKNSTKEAVIKALENPPFNTTNQDIKVIITIYYFFFPSYYGL